MSGAHPTPALALVATAALLFGMTPAEAQPNPTQANPAQVSPGPQADRTLPGPDGQTASESQVRAIETSLRQAADQLSRASPGNEPNFGQARTAVQGGMNTLGRVQASGAPEAVVRDARRDLEASRNMLENRPVPEARQAAAQLTKTADSLAALHRAMTAGAAGGAGSQQGGTTPPARSMLGGG